MPNCATPHLTSPYRTTIRRAALHYESHMQEKTAKAEAALKKTETADKAKAKKAEARMHGSKQPPGRLIHRGHPSIYHSISEPIDPYISSFCPSV